MKINTYIIDRILIFIVVFCVLIFRRYDSFVYPQLWAEDGPIFLQQYLEDGIRTLIVPYAGYLNTAQRLIVLLSAALPVNYFHLPRLYTVICFFITFFVAIQSYKTAIYLKIKHNIFYATLFLLTPITSDVFMNITNLNGILSLYMINFLIVRDNDHKWPLLNLLIIFVVALSGPASILLSPLIVFTMLKERKHLTVKRVVPLVLILFCGFIQLVCVKFIDKDFYRGIPGKTESYHFLKLFTNNIHELLFLQYSFMSVIPPVIKMTICTVVFGLFLWFLAICYVRIKNESKYIFLLCITFYLGGVIVSYWPNESKLLGLQNASRYFLVPYACIGWIILIAVDQKIRMAHIIIYLSFLFLHRKQFRALLADKDWKTQIQEYYDGKRQIININPDGWKFTIPAKK